MMILGGKEKKLLELVVSINACVAWLFEIVSVDNGDSCNVFILLRLISLRDICRDEGVTTWSTKGSLSFSKLGVWKMGGRAFVFGEE